MALMLPDVGDERWFAVRMLVTTVATVLITILVTFLTSKNGPTAQAVAFYKRLRIHGPGWHRVYQLCGVKPVSAGLKDNAIACLASIILVYSMLLGIGYALFEDWLQVAFYLVLIALSVLILKLKMPIVLANLRQD